MATFAPTSAATRPRQLTARFDVILVGGSVLLALIGVVMIYSATRGKLALAGEDPRYFLKRQGVFMVVGILVMVGLALFDYRRLEQISTVLYVGTLFALLAVLATPSSQGASGGSPSDPSNCNRPSSPPWSSSSPSPPTATADPRASSSATWCGWFCWPSCPSCW
jgi:hypothetical protein